MMISVVIPVYNGERYIDKCVQSIINQTYQNFEIILINDGSQDDSEKICKSLSRSDNRVVFIDTKHAGVSTARNIGIDNAQGEFIYFIDCDDYIENNTLELLIENCVEHNSDLAIASYKFLRGEEYDYNNFMPKGSLTLLKTDIIDYTVKILRNPTRNPMFSSSVNRLFKKNIIVDNNITFDSELKNLEEWSFHYKYLNYCEVVTFIDTITYTYVLPSKEFSNSTMFGNNPGKLFGFAKAINYIKSYLEKNHVENVEKYIGHAYIFLSIVQLIKISFLSNAENKKHIEVFINFFLQSSQTQKYLKYYQPAKGNSKIIPILMKYKQVKLLILFCKYKGKKRYQG